MSPNLELSNPELDQLRGVCKQPVWDGHLIMSCVADSLADKGLVFRSGGYTYPLPLGYAMLDAWGAVRTEEESK